MGYPQLRWITWRTGRGRPHRTAKSRVPENAAPSANRRVLAAEPALAPPGRPTVRGVHPGQPPRRVSRPSSRPGPCPKLQRASAPPAPAVAKTRAWSRDIRVRPRSPVERDAHPGPSPPGARTFRRVSLQNPHRGDPGDRRGAHAPDLAGRARLRVLHHPSGSDRMSRGWRRRFIGRNGAGLGSGEASCCARPQPNGVRPRRFERSASPQR